MWRGPALKQQPKGPRPRSRTSDLEVHAVSAIVPDRESNRGVEPPATKRRFPRSARLLRHADFERVYKQGRRHFSTSMTVFYWPRPEALTSAASAHPASGLRIGFTVGRALGGAVQRNRMKRRLREAVRLCRPLAAPDVDVVINPKKSLLTNDFSVVLNEVARAFVVIEQKLSKPAGTNAVAANASSGPRTPEAERRKPN